MPVDRIDILLNVADVERSVSFYRELLGLRLDSTWADPAGRTRWAKLVTSGDSVLMLNQPSGESLTDRPARPAYRDAVIYLRVQSTEELNEIHRRLRQSGAEPGDCQDEAYGQREFLVRDPDGYELALCAAIVSGDVTA
jgi:catechol 2,3-dioxygenase-like lactoylglutathione lyase family enzyme